MTCYQNDNLSTKTLISGVYIAMFTQADLRELRNHQRACISVADGQLNMCLCPRRKEIEDKKLMGGMGINVEEHIVHVHARLESLYMCVL
jgi:hypothetical protein